MDKKLQKVTFQASSNQIKFAEIYLDYAKRQTYEEIGKKINVTRMTIWRWFQNPDFIVWINSKKNEILNKSLIPRYKTAIRKAEAGDFSLSKLLFEMQGEYVPQQKIEGLEPIQLTIEHVAGTRESIKKNVSADKADKLKTVPEEATEEVKEKSDDIERPPKEEEEEKKSEFTISGGMSYGGKKVTIK